jgi:RNA polymerase sigma-70 factor (ECF subfamily)
MTLLNLPDYELVRQTLRGESDAYDVLIERHTSAVYRIVRRMCSDRAEAEAITQEAFLRAWESLPRSEHERPFRPWLIQIAVNAARDELKGLRPLDFADLPECEVAEIAEDKPDPEEWLEHTEALARLAAAVQELPARYRMVIALRYEAEMSYDEMARALDLPLNTVRTHLRRAKYRLRKDLENQ